MGSCVSLSSSPASAAPDQPAPPPTAKVVSPDGSMAQFAGPVTAREALAVAAQAPRDGDARGAPRLFLCGADELGFDAPARALAASEPLQPGQLYFALPAPMLRRPLSGADMAALAVRASTALTAAASPPRRGKERHRNGRGKRRPSTARVAPLLVVVGGGKHAGFQQQPEGAASRSHHHAGSTHWTQHTMAHAVGGDRTVGKARHGAAGRGSLARRRPAGVHRLSAIDEDSE